MISVSNKVWSERQIEERLIDKISQDNKLSPLVAKLIASRKFSDDEIYSIKNKINLKNYFINKRDFISGSKIIENSIKNNEKICIFGDYDVDGSCATTLLIKFLKSINHPYFYYIPDREKDGYGPSPKVLSKLIDNKLKLVIMVDCGSNSKESIDYLNKFISKKNILFDFICFDYYILNSINLFPELIGGKNRFDSEVIKITNGNIFCKGGDMYIIII